jgi:hypothetical protein
MLMRYRTKKGTHTMKKNKLIKIIASVSAMGAIGTGTAIGISSCADKTPPPPVDV